LQLQRQSKAQSLTFEVFEYKKYKVKSETLNHLKTCSVAFQQWNNLTIYNETIENGYAEFSLASALALAYFNNLTTE
jgi:hypothetical protein